MTPAEAYQVLGLSAGATAAQVQAAFRTAALRWHPDKCSQPDAAARFMRAREAYGVLQNVGVGVGTTPFEIGQRIWPACPVCSAPHWSPLKKAHVPWDKFKRWLDSDTDDPEYYWVLELCPEHYDSVVDTGFDPERVIRLFRWADQIEAGVMTAQGCLMSLDRLLFWFILTLSAIVVLILLVVSLQACMQ